MSGYDADRALVRSLVREVADFPAPGVMFRDVAGVLADTVGFAAAVRCLAEVSAAFGPFDHVAGMEARGFMFAAPLAVHLGTGFLPVRKAGKLPPPVLHASYELEYGTAALEIRDGIVEPGARVLVLDDILATGGTASAGVDLLQRAGAEIVGLVFLMELPELDGRARLGEHRVESVLT